MCSSDLFCTIHFEVVGDFNYSRALVILCCAHEFVNHLRQKAVRSDVCGVDGAFIRSF